MTPNEQFILELNDFLGVRIYIDERTTICVELCTLGGAEPVPMAVISLTDLQRVLAFAERHATGAGA